MVFFALLTNQFQNITTTGTILFHHLVYKRPESSQACVFMGLFVAAEKVQNSR